MRRLERRTSFLQRSWNRFRRLANMGGEQSFYDKNTNSECPFRSKKEDYNAASVSSMLESQFHQASLGHEQ
jgi:hypothetical protein